MVGAGAMYAGCGAYPEYMYMVVVGDGRLRRSQQPHRWQSAVTDSVLLYGLYS